MLAQPVHLGPDSRAGRLFNGVLLRQRWFLCGQEPGVLVPLADRLKKNPLLSSSGPLIAAFGGTPLPGIDAILSARVHRMQ